MTLHAHLTRRRRLAALAVVVGIAATGLAACGSQVDPNQVQGFGNTSAGGPVGVGASQSAGTLPDGTSGGTLPDGTSGGTLPDGTSGGTLPDGTSGGTLPDGTSGGTLPDGTSGGTVPGTGPGASTSTGPGASTGPGGSASANPTGPAAPGGSAPPPSDCSSLANQTGITSDTITIGNASDISGAVPGLFESAQQGTQAYVNYFNATSDICGRKLKLVDLDSKEDAGGDQQAYVAACSQDFAVVGSVSSQDQGGAATAQGCGIPDIRSFVVTPERRKCTTCFSTYTNSTNLVPRSFGDFWLKKDRDATQKAAMLYVNVPASSGTATSYVKALTSIGWKFPVVKAIDQTEFNYAPYVEAMKSAGVEYVQYYGPYQFTERLQTAMQQAGFTPKYYLQDGTIYDPGYVQQAQSAGIGAGSYVYTEQEPFETASSNPELQLYLSYLQQIDPNATPSTYGVFAWSAARLFVQQAVALGGKLTRASLVQALDKVKGWTGNGIHAPNEVGAKTTSPCVKFLQLSSSYTWSQVSPGDFLCSGGLINSGIGS